MVDIVSGRGGIWRKRKFTIPASSSIEINSVAMDKFHSVDYMISCHNDTNLKNKSLNIKIHRKSATEVSKPAVFAKIGQVNINFIFSVASGNMILTATNNESYDISLEYAFLILGT